MRLPILIAASLLALAGCAQRSDPPDQAPTGVTATPGDGVILMSWDQLPGLTYWIFYSQGGSVSIGQSGTFAVKDSMSPRAVTGLLNGTQYWLLMNATNNGSAAGPNSLTVTQTPRLAGDNWIQGAVQGAQNLNALAFNGAGRYVTVGDGTTIFSGDFNYGHTDPVGVTEWFTPTWFPPNLPSTTVPPFITDFRAVIWNGTFIALGSNGNVATSGDGVNWTPQHVVFPGVTGLNALAFGNSTFFAVGDGGQMYRTTDLTQPWTPDTTANTTNDLTSIAVLNGFFVITGSNGTLLLSTDAGTDTAHWTQQVTGLPSGTTLRSAAFMPNAFGVQNPQGTLKAISYVAVGDGGAIVTATIDQVQRDPNNGSLVLAENWTPVLLPGAQNLRSVAVGGATGLRFLAIGQGGAVVFGDSVINDANGAPTVPVNPIQWSVPSQQPPTGDFSSVHFFTGQYLTVGAAGANAVSH